MMMALFMALQVTSAAGWPHADAALSPPGLSQARPPRRWHVFLDAGHGAPGNVGNFSVLCEAEELHTLALAEQVAARLRETGRFIVTLSRTGAERPDYRERVRAAAASGADVFISLHSDARGEAAYWHPTPGMSCLRNDTDPGMGLLVSDEGPKPRVVQRLKLARAISQAMGDTGFLLYGGFDWLTLYEADAAPGVFIDRRPLRQRVFVLRAPKMPSVIVETHHALDFEENARWKNPATADAFAAALAAGLEAFFKG
ncbi:MAG: N-acetylmuramoyl-L-alanine amidase [Myxococcaceae bacterium]|nr:N-acetylmuramoyl-L-alanine amidase [Myxococcaceae bacterium]